MAVLEQKTLQLGEHILIDVDPKSEFVNMRVGDSKGFLVKKVDLWAVTFTIADAKTQELLMPIRQTEVSTFRRIHKVRLKKAMNEGDIMTVKCEISVPQVVEEGLAGNLMRKRSKIVLPRG